MQKRLQLPELSVQYDPTVTGSVYEGTEPGTEEEGSSPLTAAAEAEEWSKPQVTEQYVWNGANRLIQQINELGDITRYAYDGDGNRMKMTID